MVDCIWQRFFWQNFQDFELVRLEGFFVHLNMFLKELCWLFVETTRTLTWSRRFPSSNEGVQAICGFNATTSCCSLHLGTVLGSEKTILSGHQISGEFPEAYAGRARGEAVEAMGRTDVTKNLSTEWYNSFNRTPSLWKTCFQLPFCLTRVSIRLLLWQT